jgi:uracil-DNA glycosylase
VKQITIAPNLVAWRREARQLLARDLAPGAVAWEEISSSEPALPIFDEVESESSPNRRFFVPKEFLALAELVALHADPARWALLYRILWRLTHGEPKLLAVFVDQDVARANEMAKSVRHDIHKMRAFVRFREVRLEDGSWFVAWFEPVHHIIEHNAMFFVDRFASMRWSILTPERCAHWNGAELSFTHGVSKEQSPGEDAVEALWLTYYANIFNLARVKVKAMQSEMPKKYWRNLPETAVIPSLLQEAPQRVDRMLKESGRKLAPEAGEVWTPASVPESESLEEIAAAAKDCTACPLYRRATQTVFGEGPKRAAMMMIGEQPGDHEDLAGKPFVGPAGKMLDQALADVGIDRQQVYVTNTVKHFKWEPRGKRRIHQKPSARDIAACRSWMEAELRLVAPKVLVCLGSTAARAIFGPSFRVTKQRGQVLPSPFAAKTVVTVHPSSLLRQPDEETQEREYALFVSDLRVALETALTA